MMALLRRDLAIATRSGGAAMLGVLFFLAVVAVIPFGIGPDLNLLARIGPAILWIGALLASLLGSTGCSRPTGRMARSTCWQCRTGSRWC
jgi:heme exporter protein B